MSARSGNPLLTVRFDVPFAEIAPEHVVPAVRAAVRRARADLARLKAASGPRTYANTLGALEALTEPLEYVMRVVGHLESVATSPALRAAHNEAVPLATAFHSELATDGELLALLERLAAERGERLEPVQRRHLEKTLRTLRREGADRPPSVKAELAEIDRRLAELTNRFAQNVLDATAAFRFHVEAEERLAGLPEHVVAAARHRAEAEGRPGWILTLHQPDLIPVLTYAEDRRLREELYRAYVRRAGAPPYENGRLVVEILRLRRRKAELLGYPHFADYVLEERMARTGAQALAFLRELADRVRPFFERERAELEAFYRTEAGADAPELAPWDVAYWAERLRRANYDFDAEALRPYFELDRALEGLFTIAERLFGIEIVELPRDHPEFPQVWHPDVRYFRIYDRHGTLRAAFYADLHPRDTKRGGAWMGDFLTGGPRPEGFAPHLGVICANITPASPERPALLTHEELQTLFHEFGHLLHHSLSEVSVPSLAGTNVAWDFVELPSQLLENWCWHKEALDLFARHYQTGEPIPDRLLDAMRQARTFRAATATMRQLGFGIVDLELHMHYDPDRDGDVVAWARRVMAPFAAVPPLPEDATIANFTHLFAGPVAYAAGYYSYKWAEMLEADAFGRFEEEGILNPATGADFLEAILARGDEADPLELFVRFRGREPSLEPLLRRDGLWEEGER